MRHFKGHLDIHGSYYHFPLHIKEGSAKTGAAKAHVPGFGLELVLNASNKLYVGTNNCAFVYSMIFTDFNLKGLNIKVQCLGANIFCELLWIHSVLEINNSTLCVVTIWGQLTRNTPLIKGSHISIFLFNLNCPESEYHTEQKKAQKKIYNFETHGMCIKN